MWAPDRVKHIQHGDFTFFVLVGTNRRVAEECAELPFSCFEPQEKAPFPRYRFAQRCERGRAACIFYPSTR
jgi:hypothetical protein